MKNTTGKSPSSRKRRNEPVKPKLTKIFMSDLGGGLSCIRIDFDNDLHYVSMVISGGRDELVHALSELAFHLEHDERLDEKP